MLSLHPEECESAGKSTSVAQTVPSPAQARFTDLIPHYVIDCVKADLKSSEPFGGIQAGVGMNCLPFHCSSGQ